MIEECTVAFEQLKERLITAPILRTPSGNRRDGYI